MAIVEYLRVINTTDPNRWNCVKYARARVPSLPFGLWTLGNKVAIINDHLAKKGNVAIINVGWPWGHCAVVTNKDGRNITIQEANYRYGKITERCGTEHDLKIVGYFNPNEQNKEA